jgi:phosphotransferase system HPr-like phosphotransfer protein
MMLAASQGSQVRITARGTDAAQAIDALDRLVNARFEEDE